MRKGRSVWQLALVAILLFVGCGGGEGSVPSAAKETPAEATTAADETSGPIDIGGRSLFLTCRGSGSPTIVFEAGMTGDHRTWENVADEVADESRVCAYDRANIGQSDPAPTPRTAKDAVEDLDLLLEKAGEEPSYVLVGFSFGGIITQLYAAEHPEKVAGLVLVESNHPDETREFEKHLSPKQIKKDRAEIKKNPEGFDVFTTFDQVRAAGELPEVPLVVVTATRSEGWPPGWDPELFDRLRAEQQADLATMVPGGRQIMAEGSGHHVPSERPDVIVKAINTVLESI